MNKAILLLLSLLIIETIQQTTVKVAQNQEPFQQFDNALKRTLAQNDQKPEEIEMIKRLQKQIVIWTCIVLGLALYFTVMALIDMPNPKSSILYAKYDTTRGQNEL